MNKDDDVYTLVPSVNYCDGRCFRFVYICACAAVYLRRYRFSVNIQHLYIESNTYGAQCERGLTHSVYSDSGQCDIQHSRLAADIHVRHFGGLGQT